MLGMVSLVQMVFPGQPHVLYSRPGKKEDRPGKKKILFTTLKHAFVNHKGTGCLF